MNNSDLPEKEDTSTGDPDDSRACDSEGESQAVPSLGKLVAGGLISGVAVVKGLGFLAGIARVAAPALVGYLAREILDSRKTPLADDPRAPGSGMPVEVTPQTAEAAPVDGDVEAVEKGGVSDGVNEHTDSGGAAAAECVDDVENVVIEDAALEAPAGDDGNVVGEVEGVEVAPEEEIIEESLDVPVEVEDVVAEEAPPKVEITTEEPAVVADVLPEPFEEEEVETTEMLATAETAGEAGVENPERKEDAAVAKSDDEGGDRYGFLDGDDGDEVGVLPSKKASIGVSPSLFFIQDENEEVEASGTPSALPAACAAPEPMAPVPPLAEMPDVAVPPVPVPVALEAVAVVPPPEPEAEFPSLLDAPLPAEPSEPEAPATADNEAAASAISTQNIPILPARHSAAPPVVPPGSPQSPLVPTAQPDAVGSADDSEFDLEFDPISIFLQGLESEEASIDAKAGDAVSTLPVEPMPVDSSWSKLRSTADDLDALFEQSIPNGVGRPNVTIPKSRIPARRTVVEGGPPARMRTGSSSRFEANIEAAVAAASASPFLVALPTDPEAVPTLVSSQRPAVRTRRGKRPSEFIAVFVRGALIVLLVATAVFGAYLYFNPDRNPFYKSDAREIRQSAPLHITPVKPDGTPPVIRLTDGVEHPSAAPKDSGVSIVPALQAKPGTASLAEEPFTGVAQDPRLTLEAFLNAGATEERLRLVHLPEGIRDRMAAYAATHGEGAFSYQSVIPKHSGTVPGTAYPTHLFLITTESQPDGFPVSVEDTEAGFRVDWDAFVQFNDRLLGNFITDSSTPSAAFFVVLRRSHFFGANVPELATKLCYRVMSPISAEVEEFAFIDANSLAGEEAGKSLAWGRTYRPVVRLEWVRDGDEKPYIVITEIVRNTWRGTGVGTGTEG